MKLNKYFISVTTAGHIRDEGGDSLRRDSKTSIDISTNKICGNCIGSSDQSPTIWPTKKFVADVMGQASKTLYRRISADPVRAGIA